MQRHSIGEADIKTSLLKGDLKHLILVGDIVVECSNVELISFSDEHQMFLAAAGITTGTSVMDLNYAFRINEGMIGEQDGRNRIFTTRKAFLYGQHGQNYFRPQIFHNGGLKIGGVFDDPETISGTRAANIDYVVERSSIFMMPGTYDTIRFISFSPNSHSKLSATYFAAP
jgi:hypothetical protein